MRSVKCTVCGKDVSVASVESNVKDVKMFNSMKKYFKKYFVCQDCLRDNGCLCQRKL